MDFVRSRRNVLPMLIAVLASLPGAAEECARCGAKLCDPHFLEEKAAIEGLRKGLAAAAPKDRLAALDAYADVSRKHLNCRTPASAKALGAALLDGDKEVRNHALALLQETQDPHNGAALAGQLAMRFRQWLEKPPKTDAEKLKWDQEFDFYKSLARYVNGTGVVEASPAVADFLEAVPRDLLAVAAENCTKIRTHAVAVAVLRALERALTLPCRGTLQSAWTTITGCDVPVPSGGTPADTTKYFVACRKWLKEHQGDPDRWMK
ncbi:MAG: hypothetical protein FD180_629 [Planctomycetota bacterium]|nr:MAG: hypothetical protein FD180_629 [Planctomycetota bacterium]